MIKESAPVSIFDLFTPQEKAANERRKKEIQLMNKTCQYIFCAHREKVKNEDIEKQIKALDLPLSIHMAVFGRFSEICKYGRILTERERKIYRM